MGSKRIGSSVIAAVGYDDERHVLEVTFHTGRVYDYLDVPRSIYNGLLSAESKGKYFNRYVRPRYRAKLVGRVGSGEW